MHKKLKILFTVLLIFFCFQINSAQALPFKAQVIDQIGFTETDINENSIGNLIKAIYTYALGIVGILATIVMMYGGVLYITATGNASKMDNAKQWIFSSLTGLILALSSYTLLYMVNPNLLTMTAIKPIKPEKSARCCHPKTGIISKIQGEETCGSLGAVDCNGNSLCQSLDGIWTCVTLNEDNELLKCVSDIQNFRACETGTKKDGYCQSKNCEECKNTGDFCLGRLATEQQYPKNIQCCGDLICIGEWAGKCQEGNEIDKAQPFDDLGM